MKGSLWSATLGVAIGAGALIGCSTRAVGPDVGPLRDAAPPAFDAGPPPTDAGRLGIGTAYLRLVNLIPASPNLTVCLATIPGTGVAPTPAHIIGSPDARLMSDGTLPYPGVSPYLPAVLFDNPGFAYELRLYSSHDLPFTSLGRCPDADAQPAPILTVRADASTVMADHHYSVALIGVLPGTPVTCSGACPPPQVRVFEDDLTPPMGPRVRARLFQALPNLPAPIHVCFDLDYRVVDGTVMDGPLPPSRVLPPAADTDGLAFGEVSPYIEIPPVTSAGAFYTHATVGGVPDCDRSTLLLGPTTVPLPVPATAPIEVARVFTRGDVITNFAFGRVGATCSTAADCVAPASVCTSAACSCDATHHCLDDLSGNLLPWRDVLGGVATDAGVPDAGVDGGT